MLNGLLVLMIYSKLESEMDVLERLYQLLSSYMLYSSRLDQKVSRAIWSALDKEKYKN